MPSVVYRCWTTGNKVEVWFADDVTEEERLGIRKTTLYESFIKTGRLRFVKIGARAVGVIEDELDVLIEELRRERDRSV
jgi:hypothetical protein